VSGCLGLEQEEIVLVDDFEQSESGGLEWPGPLGCRGQVIVSYRAPELVVEGVEGSTAGEVDDEEASGGFEEVADVPQGGGLVAEVREGMEAEGDIEVAVDYLVLADIEQGKLGGGGSLAGELKHGG